MKKIVLVVLLTIMTLGASAQFEKGTKYADVALSGLNLGYSEKTKFFFGLDAAGGYFIADSWMLKGGLGYDLKDSKHDFKLGAGFRYYFQCNGIFMGTGLQYQYCTSGDHFVQLTPEVGYCFYVNHYLAIEPSVYYDVCLNDFKNGSKVGLKIGAAFYF